MDKENVLIGHIMVDLAFYPITSTLSVEEKANYYDAIMKKYRHEDYRQHLITEKVRMCFDFSCVDIDKCKQWHERKDKERKEHSSKGGIKSGEVRRARKVNAEKQDEEATDKVQSHPKEKEIFEAEEVEQFPWKEFYEPFPKHEGRKKVIEKWEKMPNSKRKLAIEGAKRYAKEIEYRKQIDRDTKIMNPLTYLNGERWTDEYETHTTTINTNYHGSNNRQSYKEAEFERNARTIVDTLERAEKGEFAYLSPFNPPSGQR